MSFLCHKVIRFASLLPHVHTRTGTFMDPSHLYLMKCWETVTASGNQINEYSVFPKTFRLSVWQQLLKEKVICVHAKVSQHQNCVDRGSKLSINMRVNLKKEAEREEQIPSAFLFFIFPPPVIKTKTQMSW